MTVYDQETLRISHKTSQVFPGYANQYIYTQTAGRNFFKQGLEWTLRFRKLEGVYIGQEISAKIPDESHRLSANAAATSRRSQRPLKGGRLALECRKRRGRSFNIMPRRADVIFGGAACRP